MISHLKALISSKNTLAAVSTSIALKINLNIIKRAVESYQPLKRRFTVLNHNRSLLMILPIIQKVLQLL